MTGLAYNAVHGYHGDGNAVEPPVPFKNMRADVGAQPLITPPAMLLLLVLAVPLASWIWYRLRIASAARKIAAKLDASFGAPHEFVQVQAADFPHCSATFYDDAQREAQALGYALLADVEDRTLSRTTTTTERTFVRLMARADGGDRFCAFEVRRRGVAEGGAIRVREFITEFAQGGAAITSDAPPAKLLDSPSGLSRQYHAAGTALSRMLEAHRALVASRLAARPEDPVLPVVSLEQYLAAWQRGYDRQRDRLAAGGLAKGELERLAGPGRAKVGKAVHEQMQRDRRRDAS